MDQRSILQYPYFNFNIVIFIKNAGSFFDGYLAQLVEYLVYTENVSGSSPLVLNEVLNLRVATGPRVMRSF